MGEQRQPWFDAAFGSLYETLYAHRSPAEARRQVDFVLDEVGLRPGQRVLDLACGNGRHLRELEARSMEVLGLDRSRDLLGSAARHGAGRLVRGDMRRLPFRGRSFRAVFSFFTSFGYFSDPGEDEAALREVGRVLETGGHWFLDFLDAAAVRRDLQPLTERRAGGLQIREERRISGDRVLKHVRVEDSTGVPRLDYEESVRLYGRDELARLCGQAGLEPRAWYGGFDGRPPGRGSRLLLIAERAA